MTRTQTPATPASVSPHEMHGHAPAGSPDTWLFDTEATSTLLISLWFVAGTFVRLHILADGALFRWVGENLVPLLFAIFYAGSGYLHQRRCPSHGFRGRGGYLRRETIIMVVPCVTFTVLTLATGSIMAAVPGVVASGALPSVETFSLGNLVGGLVVDPVVCSGYFLVLLAFYLVTPTIGNRRGMVALLAWALGAKALSLGLTVAGLEGALPVLLQQFISQWIWFCLGMVVCELGLMGRVRSATRALPWVVAFVAEVGLLASLGIGGELVAAGLTVLGLGAFYTTAAWLLADGRQPRLYGFVGRYTMAIWLMHPILTELMFTLLMALGLWDGGVVVGPWAPLYGVVCVVSCYVLPVLVLMGMNRVGRLSFLVYPARYLKG